MGKITSQTLENQRKITVLTFALQAMLVELDDYPRAVATTFIERHAP